MPVLTYITYLWFPTLHLSMVWHTSPIYGFPQFTHLSVLSHFQPIYSLAQFLYLSHTSPKSIVSHNSPIYCFLTIHLSMVSHNSSIYGLSQFTYLLVSHNCTHLWFLRDSRSKFLLHSSRRVKRLPSTRDAWKFVIVTLMRMKIIAIDGISALTYLIE